jgi:plasmid stability protein
MPGLLIKDLSPELHQKLRESATRHHRSLGKEALALLEEMLTRPSRAVALPEPVEARFLLTEEFLENAKSEGRE